MAFSAQLNVRTVMGNKRVHMGTFSQTGGDTGGDIDTGLKRIEYAECMAATNLSTSGGTLTVTTANPGGAQAGFWKAIGY